MKHGGFGEQVSELRRDAFRVVGCVEDIWLGLFCDIERTMGVIWEVPCNCLGGRLRLKC